MRGPLSRAFLVQSLLASYQDGAWQKLKRGAHTTPSLPSTVLTLTIPGSALGYPETNLPILANATIIPTRIHAQGSDGKEAPLQHSCAVDGTVFVAPPKDATQVAYSLSVPDSNALYQAIAPCSEPAYQQFLTTHRSELVQLLSPLGNLSDTCKQFLEQIDHLPPLERIGKIKQFISFYGHYDLDNREVVREKTTASPSDVLAVMETRALELKAKRLIPPEKEFAGVCAELSLLYATMLRASGIAAGIATGIVLDAQGNARESMGHAKVFVPWVTRTNERVDLELEASPDNAPELFKTGNSLTSPETAGQAPAVSPHAHNTAAQFGSKFTENLSAEHIRSLVNGELEAAVNVLLSQISPQEVQEVESLLAFLRYSGSQEVPPAPQDSAAQVKAHSAQSSSDTEMFKLISDYVSAYERDFAVQDTPRLNAISHLEQQLSRGEKALSPRAFSSCIAVLCYLRSPKMLKECTVG